MKHLIGLGPESPTQGAMRLAEEIRQAVLQKLARIEKLEAENLRLTAENIELRIKLSRDNR